MELDQKTTVHCRRTESLCNMLCRVLNLNNDIASMVCLAAEYHDIGKSKIPASILFKPGKLTDDEWKIMKTHAKIGYDLMSDFPENVRLMILYHHEDINGGGYYQNTYDVFSLNTEAGENGDQMFAAIYVVDVMECEDWKQDILLAIGQEDKRLLFMEKIMPMSQWAKEIVDYGGIVKPLANYSGRDSDNWEDFIISEEDLKNWLRELGVEKNIILF